MAGGQTEHYGLNQWQAGDPVLREDFNRDNETIDRALGEIPRIVTGTYTGNGAASQLIPLEGTPKAVLSVRDNGYMAQQYQTVFFGGLALEGQPVKVGSNTVVAIEEGGFRVYEQDRDDINANTLNNVYHYLALM